MAESNLQEGLPTPKLGQVITWTTLDGPDMGVVVGEDGDKNVLAVTAYDKALRNEPGSKKFRDAALTDSLADGVKSQIPGVMFDVHRVPKVMATLVGKLKGKIMGRYEMMAAALKLPAAKSGADDAKESSTPVGDVLESIRGVFGVLADIDGVPAADAPFTEWMTWVEKEEAPMPKAYYKVCSMDAFRSNIRYFYKVKGKDWKGTEAEKLKRGVAAAYTALRTACGTSGDADMTASEIVAAGAKR